MPRRIHAGSIAIAALGLAAAGLATVAPAARTAEQSVEITAANHRAWGAVTMADGLPSDSVNAIGQGADGAIWFGTDRGIAVADGRGTRVIALGTEDPAPVFAVAIPGDGRVVAATGYGIFVISGSTATRVSQATEAYSAVVLPDAAPGGVVAARSEDGTLWSGSSVDYDLDPIFDQPVADARLLTGDDAKTDVTAMVSLDGEVFVASRYRGLLRIAGGRVAVVRGFTAGVTALAVDPSDSSVWVGVTGGPRAGSVHRLLRDGRVATVTSVGAAVTGLAADDDGTCWVATNGAGAYLVSDVGIERHDTFASTIGGLRSDALRCAFRDREGVVWFGSDRGASRFDRRGPDTRAVGRGRNGDVVRSISRAGGRLWIGTNSGLAAGGVRGELAPVAGLDGRSVFDVEAVPDGRLLAATQQGVFVSERPGNRAPVFSPVGLLGGPGELRGRAVAVFDGTVYVGTFGAGLFRLSGDDLVTVEFVGAGDAIRDIVSLHTDPAGSMWIGTAGRGVFRRNLDGLTPLDSPAVGDRTTYAIAGSEAGTLWFATSAGLVVRDGTVEARILEDCDVRSVAPLGERSALCATANRGAVLVRWDDRFGWLETRIDEERGLPSGITFAVDAVPDAGGSFDLLVGTSRGLTAYRTSTAKPAIGIAGALANVPLTPSEVEAGIVLAYPQRSVVVEFFATSTRTFRGQFQYGFTVSRPDGTPVDHGVVRDAKIPLDRLEPGQYRIDAVAFDNDLVASDGRTILVTVERAPFPWAIAGLAALLVVALLVLFWGARQNRVIVRTNEALRAANADLADARAEVARETERERSRIARDLHDQTLADLRRLMLLSDKLPAPVSDVSPRPGELRQRIEEVSGEIRRICEDLSPSALANLGLGPALEWLVSQAQAEMPADRRFAARVTFSNRLEEGMEPGSDVPIQIYRIVQEAITNVCRHADACNVEVRASIDDRGDLTVEVEDDGVGFEPAGPRVDSGRGVGNMRWRADMIGATIEWTARAGGGTVVTLRRTRH